MKWRPIDGYPYEVNDRGIVRRVVDRYGRACQRVLKWRYSGDGRPFVTLYHKGRQRQEQVSVLVLESFVGPRPSGMYCCHNDGNPQNNHVDNLRWDTPKGNSADRYKHGTAHGPQFATRGRRKLTDEQVREIRRTYDGNESFTSIGKRYGLTYRSISLLLSGQTWAHLKEGDF